MERVDFSFLIGKVEDELVLCLLPETTRLNVIEKPFRNERLFLYTLFCIGKFSKLYLRL